MAFFMCSMANLGTIFMNHGTHENAKNLRPICKLINIAINDTHIKFSSLPTLQFFETL